MSADRARIIPGCTSCGSLNSHHFEYRSQCGSNATTNQGAACVGHHGPMIHRGVIEIGGWAPYWVITKLGIHPKTGRAFRCYINKRRVSQEVADRELAIWRKWLREQKKGGKARRAVAAA